MKPRLINILYAQQKGVCFWCSTIMDPETDITKGKSNTKHKRVTIDHIIPLSRGGRNCETNKFAACRKCNSERGNLLAKEYIDKKIKDFNSLISSEAFRRYIEGSL